MVNARPGTSLTQIERKVDGEIASLAKDGPSQDELQQSKRRVESARATKIDRSVSTDAVGLGFEVLAGNIDQAFAIIADVVLHPAFKQFSFDTNRIWQYKKG